MESESKLLVGHTGDFSDSENGEHVEDCEQKEMVTADLLRVDSCLICGEAAVFYDAGGAQIKRERSSIQYSYQQLFHCLCKSVELRKNCKLKKDWNFYWDPFPACESCEQLLVALAELYFKVELAEEELRALIQSSEDKYLRCNLYEKHHEKYRSFRKQVLTKDILKRQSEAFQNTNYKNESDVQLEKCGSSSLIVNNARGDSSESESIHDSPQPELTTTYDQRHPSASDFRDAIDACLPGDPLPNKTFSVIGPFSLGDGNKRRSLRKRQMPTYFSASSDDDENAGKVQAESSKPSKTSSNNAKSPVLESNYSDEKASEEEFKIKPPPTKSKRVSKSITSKKKAFTINDTPSSSVDSNPTRPGKAKTGLPKPKRKYSCKKPRQKSPPRNALGFSRCPVCDKPIPKEAFQEYKEHYWTHLSEEERRAFHTDQNIRDLSNIPPMKHIKHKRKTAPFSERVAAGEVIQCQTCGKFIKKNGMETHQKTHLSLDKRKTYLCYLCGASFSFQLSLDRHLNKTHPDGKVTAAFKCRYPHCDYSYSGEPDLKSHVKEAHCTSSGDTKEYMCFECGRVLWNAHVLKQHGLVHTKERKHVCHYCSKTFPLRSTLVTHLAAVHGEGKKQIMCEQTGCRKEFSCRPRYSAHLRRVHGIYVGNAAKGKTDNTPLESGTREKNKFVCDLCGVVFKYNVSLKAHLSKVHPTGKEGPYVCLYPSCTSNFFTEPDLQNHVQQDHVATYEGDQHLCGLCGRLVKHACAFKTHQLVHTKERNHVCHICSKTFPLKATLIQHLEGVHAEGNKEFKCEQEGCTEVFPTRVYFMCHMRRVHGIYAMGKRSSVKRMSTKL